MKVLICGSRHYEDFAHLCVVMNTIRDEAEEPITTVIHGAARGADTMGGRWAIMNKIPVEVYPADWNRYGRRAGYLRNQQMLDEGHPDLVVAFLFPDSRGTKMMVDLSQKAGVPTIVHRLGGTNP